MLDLLLGASMTIAHTTHGQILAQSQAALVYLPISTKQSTRANCVTYVATNTTEKTVRDVKVNRRDKKGKIVQNSLQGALSQGILRTGESVAFDLCDNSFVNVEAK
jgi:hypothetical protein